ncbi:MAG: GNAT family N-acetyltransferase [Tannerellaceae bacterium]|nr:GNAT family N-acetyltransferase [Tannerellaceae bacterium]
MPNSRKKKLTVNIPYEKSLSSYPALLIGRLGVHQDFGKRGIGSELIRFIRTIALNEDNWSGCRYLTVDAYNNEIARNYYETNGFLYLFSTEKQEKEYIGMPENRELKTRLMYFDLIQLSKVR